MGRFTGGRFTGSLFAVVSCCVPAFAQSALAGLEQAATQTQQQWFSLASGLEGKLARIAPCDFAAPAAIEETHRASTARLTALMAFVNGVAAQAAQDAATARAIQKSETEYVTGLAGERTDTEQERAGIASQMTNLAESVRKRVTLTVANDELRALEASVRDRAALVAANVTASEAALPRFEALVQALDKREAALRKQTTSLEEERLKWNGYYAARLARAQVECTETGR